MMRKYVSVDLETTGLRAKEDRILEIGALKVCGGRVLETYHTFADPRMKVPGYITRLTGICQEMVDGQPGQEKAVEGFLDFCGELPLLGHNIMFDYRFLKHLAVNCGRDFEKQAADTLHIARRAFPGLPSKSLDAMCVYYNIERPRVHRAFDDARATMALYELLWSEFCEKNPGWFQEKPLVCKVKRQTPLTSAQKRYLNDLIKYHTIELDIEIDSLTRSEASRMIDKILLNCGKIGR